MTAEMTNSRCKELAIFIILKFHAASPKIPCETRNADEPIFMHDGDEFPSRGPEGTP